MKKIKNDVKTIGNIAYLSDYGWSKLNKNGLCIK